MVTLNAYNNFKRLNAKNIKDFQDNLTEKFRVLDEEQAIQNKELVKFDIAVSECESKLAKKLDFIDGQKIWKNF